MIILTPDLTRVINKALFHYSECLKERLNAMEKNSCKDSMDVKAFLTYELHQTSEMMKIFGSLKVSVELKLILTNIDTNE